MDEPPTPALPKPALPVSSHRIPGTDPTGPSSDRAALTRLCRGLLNVNEVLCSE